MKTKTRFALASIAVSPLLAVALMAGVASAATLSRTLDLGDQGADVTSLQTFLAADTELYPSGLVTGYYGELTKAGVERYQTKRGIVSSGTPATTGYGRVGPTTLATINAEMGGGGSVPLPTGDINAPIITVNSTSVTTNSATINWTTNENATSRVLYSTSIPFLFATAPSVGSVTGVGTSGMVTIPNLQSNTTYYYTVESVDASGNLQWSIGHSFKTN